MAGGRASDVCYFWGKWPNATTFAGHTHAKHEQANLVTVCLGGKAATKQIFSGEEMYFLVMP